MAFVKSKDGSILDVKNMGQGKPAVLIHGSRLTGDMFELQTLAMLDTGYRVITYDRRGFGQSEHAACGYDYNTFGDDLESVIGELALENVALVSFSMGGGEITRYLIRHGPGRIAKAALVSSIVPHLLKGDDNPEGVDESVFDTIRAQDREDRCAFHQDFAKQFYGGGLISSPVSQRLLDCNFLLGVMSSPKATVECTETFAKTDTRSDLASFTLPALIIHGTAEKIVPSESSGRAAASGIAGAQIIEYHGEPHGFFATVPTRLPEDLIRFIA